MIDTKSDHINAGISLEAGYRRIPAANLHNGAAYFGHSASQFLRVFFLNNQYILKAVVNKGVFVDILSLFWLLSDFCNQF